MPRSIIERLRELGDVYIQHPVISPIQLQYAQDMHINISMLRLDEVHPIISGNKLFKLQYFLEEAMQSGHKTIITFGGAYSNHLAATAYACNMMGIKCIGIVRGDELQVLSETLIFCQHNGMALEFSERKSYARMASIENNAYLLKKYGEHILIPEGGFSLSGMEGASSIATYYTGTGFSHICIPIGTGTSLAGILKSASGNLSLLGFPALKGLRDIQERLHVLGIANQTNVSIKDAYHFGGFGKYTNDLITFLNNFYEINSIPLDFVYTGKMMFGVQDLLKKKYFPAGSEILCIHTGGLQGNNSIKGRLIY